jgi:hypothetical protein
LLDGMLMVSIRKSNGHLRKSHFLFDDFETSNRASAKTYW